MKFSSAHTSIFMLTMAVLATSICSFHPPKPSPIRRASSLKMSIIPATIKVNDLIASRRLVVFATSNCPHTNRVLNLFDTGFVQYTRVNLDKVPEGPDMMDALIAMTGRTQVPLIFGVGKFMGTSDSIVAMNAAGRLGAYLEDIGAIPEDRLRELKEQWTSNYKLGFADGPSRSTGEWSLM